MSIQRNVVSLFLVAICGLILSGPVQAGLFQLDFSSLGGSAAGWDTFDRLDQDASNALTDFSGGGDDDVTLTALDDGFSPNNPAPPGVGTSYDGITVPKEAVDDYLFKTIDAAGTSARLRFDNLDPGQYNITVFAGRLTDPSQFAKIWVGGSEPASENTGSFASGGATVTVDIGAGDTLWYRHLEDNTGGISGMIINPVPEPGSLLLLLIGSMGLLCWRSRRG